MNFVLCWQNDAIPQATANLITANTRGMRTGFSSSPPSKARFRAKGERQRDRVLTDAEIALYLDKCRQPWKDAATLILGTGMRPGEVYRLRWEFVLLNGSGRMIQVSEGKSRAARALLPLIPPENAGDGNGCQLLGAAFWAGAGVPKEMASVLARFDTDTAKGYLGIVSGHFEQLTGRKPTALADFLAAHKPAIVS